MNQVTFLGQAGIFIEFDSVKILCDPWLSKTGGFLGSWHQFPRNDFIDWKKLYSATHLYVSHKHQDHFDADFLKTMPKDVEVLLPNHLSGFLWKKMRSLGFSDITPLSTWESKKLSGEVNVTMILEPVKYIEDSAMLFELGNFKLMNRNDCKLSEEYSRKLAERSIDLLFIQFSGAQYYPVMYEYGLKEKQQKIDLFLNNLKNSFRQRVNWISPKVIVPSAGPACFLDQNLFHLNFGSIFPDAAEFEKEAKGKVDAKYEILTPGQALTIPEMDRVGNSDFRAYTDKESYLLAYAEDRGPIIKSYLSSLKAPDGELYEELKAHLEGLCTESDYLAKRVNALIHFHVSGLKPFDLFADFRSGEMVCSKQSEEEPNYEVNLDSKHLLLILNEELSWEDFLLSMRVSLKRNPDVYNWPLFALLRFGYSKALLRLIEKISIDATKESIVVESDGQKYEIQRYCPHAGEDLKKGTVRDGTITCCRHYWCFDLKTGKCLYGGNGTLKTRKIEQPLLSK